MAKNPPRTCEVVIIGAGPAGIGMACVLRDLGIKNYVVLDQREIGASFDRWPKQMRLITPSFPTNSIGMLDLNSIALGTSPAYTLQAEHPTGKQYAQYLRAVAAHYKLRVKTDVRVTGVQLQSDGVFRIATNNGYMLAQNVIWAAGEFQTPRRAPFPGAELCTHNSQYKDWTEFQGDEALIIGGYESGIDAAIHLVDLGKKVRILERKSNWDSIASDPSVALSTYTMERLQAARKTGLLELIDDVEVTKVERHEKVFTLTARNGTSYRSRTTPILATGFETSARLIHDLWDWREDGLPLVSELDESTITPGLFLSGPSLRHEDHVFCFIYKFRQRFAVVAAEIGKRLGYDVSKLDHYRQWGMYLDDLSCCGQSCEC
jgi:putative flavoprotein involved in K+ transport